MRTMPGKHIALSRDEAEILGIDALGFLAGDEHRLVRFLQLTGLSPTDLRRAAGSTAFLAGVLDFIAADESLLLVFASEKRIDPATVLTARRALQPDAGDY
jgi:Protein of unknown function (DUF3572)